MKKLLSIILSITMLLSMGTVAFADGVDGPMQKAKLTVGINAEFPPFEYYEGEELKGFDIDLMNYIGERIGFDIEFVNMSFDKLIPAVVNGEVNCAISAITITKERESVIDYSTPYLIANVTYKDGEDWAKSKEKYAIVFPSMDKTSIKSSVTPEEFVYSQINIAIEELRDNHTIEKLVEKYNLNKPFDDEADANYSYLIPTTTVDDVDAEPIDEIDWTEATTVPAPSEWASKDIDLAYAVGIADTNKDYIYKNNITREEFCELIYNLINVLGTDIEDASEDFADTDNKSVAALFTMGIINGKNATEFAPNDYLTREEAATIIVRMVNKVVPMAATEEYFNYEDISEVSEWASDSIQYISNLGFMNGVGNNNFAPKDKYTTEQAIATLVRVYRGAGASGLLDENTSIGIIGGADGPTSIIVGDNVNVIEQEDYDNFYVEVKKNTTKVNDFYVDEAIKLTTESGTLASDEEFIRYYAPSKDIDNKVLSIGAVDYNKPTEVYYIAANREQIINNIKALSDEELDGFDIEKLLKLNRIDFSVIGNLINASYGAENLAALTILTNSRGYVMPKDFTDDFAIYLQYDGEYSALVSFSKFGDGVIKATMSFVNNGERDNIFRRIYEITQGLGEDSIDVALVK